MIDFEKLWESYFPEDYVMEINNENSGVECDLVKSAMEKDPIPVVYY